MSRRPGRTTPRLTPAAPAIQINTPPTVSQGNATPPTPVSRRQSHPNLTQTPESQRFRSSLGTPQFLTAVYPNSAQLFGKSLTPGGPATKQASYAPLSAGATTSEVSAPFNTELHRHGTDKQCACSPETSG